MIGADGGGGRVGAETRLAVNTRSPEVLNNITLALQSRWQGVGADGDEAFAGTDKAVGAVVRIDSL